MPKSNELKLRACLLQFLNLIDENYIRSEKNWKSEVISKGAFEYIRQRQVISHVLINRLDIVGEDFYEICAPITIDIKSGLQNTETPEKYEELFKEWIACFDNIGYIDRQPVFDYPMKNLNDFDKKMKEFKDQN